MSNSISQQVSIKNKKNQRPKTYFDLIQKVGSDGKYQFNMFLIFVLVWFITGIILMNTSFLFLNKSFQCKTLGLLVNNCQSYVCQLPEEQWGNFIVKNDDDFKSIATDNGPFYCEDQIYLDLTKSSAYLGSFLGFIIFSMISDNLGRRKSLLLAQLVTAIGTIILSLSSNLPMAALGLVLSGGGANASIGMTFYFLGQTVEDKKRQKYSVLIQISFTIGAILVTGLNYVIPNWQINIIIVVTIPSLISLFLVYTYVQQTPQFLLRQQNSQSLKSLNKIGYINFKIKDILQQQDILSVKQAQSATKQFNQITVTPFDLIKFGSLRSITICCCLICFIVYALYYGPVFVVDEIGFNIYVSNVIIQLSELVIFLPCYYYIEEMKRKFMGLTMFGTCVICSGILIFVKKPEDCDMCVESIIELVIIFIFRAAVSLYFCIFYLYVNQLYPSRVSGIGLGIISAIGIIATTVSPIVLGTLKRNDFDIMIIFCAISILAMGLTNLMDETLGKPIKAQIQQIQMLKDKRKTQVPIRGSFRKVSPSKKSFSKKSQIKSSLLK